MSRILSVLSSILLLVLLASSSDCAALARQRTPGKQVVVIGGGVAGLSAAYSLRERGCDVVVLEKGERVGGRVVSGHRGPLIYAKGTEYLGKPEGRLAQLIAALKLKPRELRAPMDAHSHAGKLYWGDDGLALLLIQGSSVAEFNRFVSTVLRLYAGYEEVPKLAPSSPLWALDDLSARQWFKANGLAPIYQEVYNVASRGLFGASIDEISALSFLAEIAFDFEGTAAVASADDLENTPDEPGERTGAYSFVGGIAEVTDALGAHLGPERVRLHATAESVTKSGQRYVVRWRDRNHQLQTLEADAVVSAVPAPVALKLAPTLLSAEQRQLLGGVAYAQYLTVALFSAVPIFDQAFDLAVPDGMFFTDVYDGSWVQRANTKGWPKKQAEYVVTLYVAPAKAADRELLSLTDEAVLKRTLADLDKLFPGASAKVHGHDIQRFPYGYPVMGPGAYRKMTALHAATSGGLALAGDYLMYPTFEAAVETGHMAAKQVLAYLKR